MQAFKSIKNAPLVTLVTNVLLVLGLVMALFFSPHARAQSGNVYGAGQAQSYGHVEEGVVLQVNIKVVQPEQSTNMVGTTVGGLIGGLLLGSNQNQDWQTRAASGVIGATVGGIVGSKVTSATMSREAQEIVIGIKDRNANTMSRVITVVQPEPFSAVSGGDQVLVTNTNGTIRVIKKSYGDLASR